jgi:predicted DNA-binding transcriptional regulator AlpA
MTAMAEPIERLLTDREVSLITGAARSTLAKMRVKGDGPLFVRVGTAVRYPEESLREWIAALPVQKSTTGAA